MSDSIPIISRCANNPGMLKVRIGWRFCLARPVKWSRDLYPIRDRASRSRTETWSRQDIERLFGVGRASAQSLMKAIGEVQAVAGAHFIERTSLLSFLDEMIAAPSVEDGLRLRLLEAEAPPAPGPLRVALPTSLRNVMLRDLPPHIRLSAGRLEITAESAVSMLESLALLAQAMQNDLVQIQSVLEPPTSPSLVEDDELHRFLATLRDRQT